MIECNTPQFQKNLRIWRLLRYQKEMLKVYSDNIVDVVFGDGPLGFRIGESESGGTIVTDFSEDDSSSINLIHVRNGCAPQTARRRPSFRGGGSLSP